MLDVARDIGLMTPPETLHTARLVLRKPTREDAPLMFAAYGQDAEVAHYLTWRPHTCVADSEAVIGHFLDSWHDRCEFHRRFAGRGISSALLSWAVERARSLRKGYLRLDCEASRPKLCAVYESFGFLHHSDRQVGPYFVSRYQYIITGLVT